MLKKLIVSLVLAAIVLTGCSATDADIPAIPTDLPPGVPTGLPPLEDILPPDVARVILDRVSEIVGAPVESAQLKSVQPMDWTDSCLGLGEPNETCAQVITPGWLLVFEVNGQEFRFRADQTGAVIRREP